VTARGLTSAGLRPQLKVVRGGGSAPLRSAETSEAARDAATCSAIGAAVVVAPTTGSISVAAQTAGQSAAQRSAQQSISSWPAAMCEELAIGHSGEGTANAGPDATARERASQIRAQRRHMFIRVNDALAGGNALALQELTASSESPSLVVMGRGYRRSPVRLVSFAPYCSRRGVGAATRLIMLMSLSRRVFAKARAGAMRKCTYCADRLAFAWLDWEERVAFGRGASAVQD
jgi:hypothetical protein